MPPMTASSVSWRQALFNRRMLICVFTGFSSGLPLYLLINLLPAWLRSEQVDLRSIGLFALIQLPFTWKFFWAPLLDRYALPLLGRRRGWMLVTQVLLLASIPLFGALSPRLDLWTIAYLAAVVALFAATQDIVLDAYRRELLPDPELGLGNAIHVQAYRISSLVPGALALILADHFPWQTVFTVTALFMLPGIVNTFLVAEPALARPAPRTLTEAVVEPFHEFITRAGVSQALLVLAFIFLYKLGDSMATALATPFYLDMGLSRPDILNGHHPVGIETRRQRGGHRVAELVEKDEGEHQQRLRNAGARDELVERLDHGLRQRPWRRPRQRGLGNQEGIDDAGQHEERGDREDRLPGKVIGQDERERTGHKTGNAISLHMDRVPKSQLGIRKQLAAIRIENDVLRCGEECDYGGKIGDRPQVEPR